MANDGYMTQFWEAREEYMLNQEIIRESRRYTNSTGPG